MRTTTFLGLAMGLALAGVGCGGGGSSFNAGVDDQKQLDELNDQEVQTVCMRLQDYLQNEVYDQAQLQTAGCTVAGIYAEKSFPGVTCEELVRDCDSGTSEPPSTDLLSCSDLSSANVTACNATVGELEACLTEINASLDGVANQLTCSIADDPNWEDEITQILGQFQSPTCEQVSADCPLLGFSASL